jgi:hypothetical protein
MLKKGVGNKCFLFFFLLNFAYQLKLPLNCGELVIAKYLLLRNHCLLRGYYFKVLSKHDPCSLPYLF